MKTAKQLVDAALAEVKTLPIHQTKQLVAQGMALLVDIRDIREVDREGIIEGAFHAPRGLLEFWIDPESPYHKPILATDKTLIFYCASGWRSALAAKTAQDMGFLNVAHMDGGFEAWKEAESET